MSKGTRTFGESATAGYILGMLSRMMRDQNRENGLFEEITLKGNTMLVRWNKGPSIEVTLKEVIPPQVS